MNRQAAKSIYEALDAFGDAINESEKEVKDLLISDYKKLRSTVSEAYPDIRGTLRDIKDSSIFTLSNASDRIKHSTSEATTKVDKAAHANPWQFIGAAALLSVLLGFALGRGFGKSLK